VSPADRTGRSTEKAGIIGPTEKLPSRSGQSECAEQMDPPCGKSAPGKTESKTMNHPALIHRLGSAFFAMAAALLLILVTGCGTGSYNEKLEQRVQQLNADAANRPEDSEEAEASDAQSSTKEEPEDEDLLDEELLDEES